MEKSIIKELFEAKCDDFEQRIMKKEKNCNKELDEITDIFDNLIEKYDNENTFNFKETFEKVYLKVLDFTTKWNLKYYGLGIEDGFKFREELHIPRYNKKFFGDDNLANCLTDFLEEYKVKVIYKDETYSKNKKRISYLLDEFPNLREYIENEEIISFNREELQALLEIIGLKEDQMFIENSYIFKLGIQEGRL